MNCPVCDQVKMREVEKDGVQIDICPSCKGVWLDRGELDKLLQGVKEIRQPFNQWYDSRDKDDHQYRSPEHSRQDYQKHHPDHDYSKHKHKKKKSVLDIFDDLFD